MRPVETAIGTTPVESLFLSSQRIVNLYPEANPLNKGEVVFRGFPGMKYYAHPSTKAGRGQLDSRTMLL